MAGPTINESQYMQFTAADQESTEKFTIYSIVWASFTGSVIANTDVLNLEDGAGKEVLKLIAVTGNLGPITVNFPYGLTVTGLKAEDLTHGYVYVYGRKG